MNRYYLKKNNKNNYLKSQVKKMKVNLIKQLINLNIDLKKYKNITELILKVLMKLNRKKYLIF